MAEPPTILPLRDGRYRTWPLPGLGRLASLATRPPQAAAWEPALRDGDWRTPRTRLTDASEQNAPVSIETKAPPYCTHAVRLPAERTHERPTITAVGREMRQCREMMRDTANVSPTFVRLTSSCLLDRKKLQPFGVYRAACLT